MVVSIDKSTAVRMYDKVQKHWKKHIKKLKEDLKAAKGKEAQHDIYFWVKLRIITMVKSEWFR